MSAGAVTLTTAVGPSDLRQRIDGFGTCLSGDEATQAWFQSLYFDDARFTIERMGAPSRRESQVGHHRAAGALHRRLDHAGPFIKYASR
jgi:hypothetical protein